jgi:hypothetical protein
MATTLVWTYRRVDTDVDLTGYNVEAVDGLIGTVDEATAQAGESYLVVDTGPWIFGKRVLLPAGVVDRIDTAERKVFVAPSREEIKNAPEYDRERGATDTYRQRVGSYYAADVGTPRPERPPARQRASRRRATPRKTSSSARGKGRSASARGRGRTGRGTQGRATDEPTRDQLYEQAKRLGIEGRSKMNKTQLKRAVGRRQGSSGSAQRGRSTPTRRGQSAGRRRKANPVEVQSFLEGVSYPTRKGDLLREAERSGASRTVRSTLERLPNERFGDPTEVSEAIGTLR